MSIIKFDFDSIPIPLSREVVIYICPKCKSKFEAPVEMVHEFELDDKLHGLPISTPPYSHCQVCGFTNSVPLDYHSKRGFHHLYKE